MKTTKSAAKVLIFSPSPHLCAWWHKPTGQPDPQAALAKAKAAKLHDAADAAQAFIEQVAGLSAVPQ